MEDFFQNFVAFWEYMNFSWFKMESNNFWTSFQPIKGQLYFGPSCDWLKDKQLLVRYFLNLNFVQVNLFQKHLFLYQLTHNMTTDCSLNYKFNTWKFQAQTWGEHVVYKNCSECQKQFCIQHVLPMFCKKEELLKKIYLY